MRKIEEVTLKNGKNLKEVLELHKKWLEGSEDGRRADLSYENLFVPLSSSRFFYYNNFLILWYFLYYAF